jgi:hypothetical protein
MAALRKMDLSHVTVFPPREEEAFSMLQHSFTDLCPTRGSNRRMWAVPAADVKLPPCCCALLTRRDFDRAFQPAGGLSPRTTPSRASAGRR